MVQTESTPSTHSTLPLIVLLVLLCSSFTRGSSSGGITSFTATFTSSGSSWPTRRFEDPAITLNHSQTQDEDITLNETDHEDEHHYDHVSSTNTSSTGSGTSQDDAGASSNNNKPWAEVIVTSLIIKLVTLIGIVVLTGEFVAKHVFKRDVHHSLSYINFTHNAVPSFACGALLATSAFLILPESLGLITSYFAATNTADADAEGHHEGHHRFLEKTQPDGHEDNFEGQIVWRFGACVIGGFLLPVLTTLTFPHCHDDAAAASLAEIEAENVRITNETDKLRDAIPDVTEITEQPIGKEGPFDHENGGRDDDGGGCSAAAATDDNGNETSSLPRADSSTGTIDLVVMTEDHEALPYDIDYSLAASILAGDFFHNFADGIFVGTSFMRCSKELAITLSAATIYHEIAQEIADYFVLTRFCNIPPGKALFCNFVSGFSVLFGACLIVGIDDISDVTIGSILGVSGGFYIYIAVAECFPRAKASLKTLKAKLISLAAFLFGVFPIALVLLTHGHCEAGH